MDLWLNDEIRHGSLFQNIARLGRAMAERAEKMVTVCQELVGNLEDIEGAAVIQREIASIAMEMKEIIQNVEVICTQCPERYVYAASLSRKTDRPQNKLGGLARIGGGDAERDLVCADPFGGLWRRPR